MGPQVVLRFPKTMSEEKIEKIVDHFQQIDPSKSIQVDRYDETLQFNQASEAHEDNATLKFKRAYEAQKAHIGTPHFDSGMPLDSNPPLSPTKNSPTITIPGSVPMPVLLPAPATV